VDLHTQKHDDSIVNHFSADSGFKWGIFDTKGYISKQM